MQQPRAPRQPLQSTHLVVNCMIRAVARVGAIKDQRAVLQGLSANIIALRIPSVSWIRCLGILARSFTSSAVARAGQVSSVVLRA